MLWTLLNLVCFFACLLASLGAARDARAGFNGYLVASIAGLLIAGACTWLMWSATERVGAVLETRKEPKKETHFRMLFVGDILWIFAAVWFTDHLAHVALLIVQR